MAVRDILEGFKQRGYVGGKSATRVFSCACDASTTEGEILLALFNAWGIRQNGVYPNDSSLHVPIGGIAIGDGLVERKITVSYEFGNFTGTPDPLQQKSKLRILSGSTTEPIDRDIHGNPLLNSAGDPPNPKPTRFIRNIGFEVTRYESQFNFANAFSYQDTCNSDTVQVGAIGSFAPGTLLCESVQAPEQFDFDAAYIKMVYVFRARRGFAIVDGLWDSWKIRFLDQGRRSWYHDPADDKARPGQIFIKDGSQYRAVTSDVLLNGRGQFLPDHGGFSVTDQHYTGVNADPLPSQGTPVEQDSEDGSKILAWYLVFDNYESKALNALNLF